ncbi:hypothetical protein PtA15_14A18 [Puccinia triticina]|uniref:PQ loop repeat protein n=1 Tax=Puccinia triticina TaxID=208348 RepID=A0ABY7D3H9_9BASI|nr:uncharacterized protein PtA15_14A18 [Puccinia triticina]WAQ91138.1 hypothetical protein PtA15_14A18 [Puccinia triticina]
MRRVPCDQPGSHKHRTNPTSSNDQYTQRLRRRYREENALDSDKVATHAKQLRRTSRLHNHYDWFIQASGFFSLGLESTLPIPQLITNFRRKSLAGLSSMVLFGWLFGDSFKSIYLVFITPDSNSIQFKICALFQLSIDILILAQALIYRRQTKLDSIELDGSPDHSASAV